MPVQITIVGLGQIGASIGLALGKHGNLLQRIGHDKSLKTARDAEKKGAVDAVKVNLPSAVREAKLVVLSLPLHEIRETLEIIAQDLPEGAVVLDTAPVKSAVAQWARELLPEGRYYVGMLPALNPQYLHRVELGLDAAEADLFHDSVIMLVANPGIPEEAVRLATDLVALLGGSPVLADIAEIDGLVTSTHLAPQLLAAALLNALVDQPGWADARKLAGRSFAAVTAALAYQDEIDALQEAAVLNQSNVIRVLDTVIVSLQGLRDDVANGDRDQLAERLQLALGGRERWFSDRLKAEWSKWQKPDLSEIPSLSERLFGSSAYLRKKK